jgi:hypothetical protein
MIRREVGQNKLGNKNSTSDECEYGSSDGNALESANI